MEMELKCYSQCSNWTSSDNGVGKECFSVDNLDFIALCDLGTHYLKKQRLIIPKMVLTSSQPSRNTSKTLKYRCFTEKSCLHHFDYMDPTDRINETCLPPKESF